MYKKSILLLIMMLPLLVKAQLATGEWYNFPVFLDNNASTFQMTEGGNNVVYFTSAGNLFSYDNNTKETYSYTTNNRLSDNCLIDTIVYNHASDYLMVIYENCNIDLLYPGGKTVNMSDIKDAIMSENKVINDVCFYKGRIYVATSFGLVVFDEKKHYVIESGNYGMNIPSVIVHKDYIILNSPSGRLYMSPVDKNHISFSSFKEPLVGTSVKRFFNLGDDENVYAFIGNNKEVRTFKFNYNYSPTNFHYDLVTVNLGGVTPMEGWVGNNNTLVVTDKNTTKLVTVKNESVVESKTLPSQLKDSKIATFKDFNKLWSATKKDGISYYDISTATPTVLVSAFKPDACNLDIVGYLTPRADGSRIYASNIGPSRYKKGDSSEGFTTQGCVDVIIDGMVKNVTLDSCTSVTAYIANRRKKDGTKVIAPSHVAVDKVDPSIYYLGGTVEGIYKIKDGVELGLYNGSNSPIESTYCGPRPFGVAVDRGGNLWMVSVDKNGKYLRVHVLPFAKTQLPVNQVKASDWVLITEDLPTGSGFFMDVEVLCCQHSDMVFILKGNYNTTLTAIDTKGTFDDFTDDEMRTWTKFVDQDGKDFKVEQCYTLIEDKDGKVWVAGNTTGVMEIPNPSLATNPSMTVNRIKVPRNDGTDYADYLLSSENIFTMCVDPSNRKWIGTQASGLYLVSERGDRIIEHFDTDNSMLPDNRILAVRADMNSNRVYIGTLKGLTLYNSTSSPAADDYKEVVAFPNPVRPGYTGWITINGLMDNSLVKICDSMGATLYEGESEGGTFMWDGCERSGSRVKSGVYYVYASQNSNGSASGAPVTKILVVN